MNIELNLSLLLQAIIGALVLAVGRIVYQSSIKLAELNVSLIEHTKQDAENFGALHQEVSDLKQAQKKRARR